MRILLILALSCQFCFAQNWQSLGSGLNYFTTSMYSDSVLDKLIVSGWFSMADSQVVNGITNYDTSFHTMPPGFNTSCPAGGGGDIWTIARYGSWIYFGGNFDCVSGMNNTVSIARWNGVIWDSVPGGGIPFQAGVVSDMSVYNNELYICGTFTSISGVAANRIAKFNGTGWSAVGNNYNFPSGDVITRITFYHGKLYIAGNLTDPQGNLFRMAVWDGVSWEFLNKPSGGIANVWDLEVYNDELYVCGEFYFDDGNPGTSIIRWNDTTWRDVGGSVQEYASPWSVIKEMRVNDGKLYCVGGFQKIGNVEARGLASWDGTNWCGYSTSFDMTSPNDWVGCNLVEFFRDTMYVSGNFMYLDSMQVNFIAKWVGGNYVDTCGTAVGIIEPEYSQSVLIFPNPTNTVMTFQFSASSNTRAIIVTDNLGREIWRRNTTDTSVEFPAYEFSSGMYFYRVEETGSIKATGKFVIQH